jgi:hypothetical protein
LQEQKWVTQKPVLKWAKKLAALFSVKEVNMSRYTATNYIRDEERLDSLANALGSSFEKKAERERAQADLQAKMQHEKQMEIDKEQRLRERRQQELETAKGAALDPKFKGMSIDVGDVSFKPQTNDYQLLKLLADKQEKDVDNTRLETKAIQDEYNRLTPEIRKKMLASGEVLSQLENPSQMTRAQIGAGLAKLASSGTVSDYEQKAMQPSTLKSYLAGAVNFAFPGAMDPYTDYEKGNIRDIIKAKHDAYKAEMERASSELGQRAPILAPSLHRSGKLPTVMSSLGASITGEAPAGGDLKRSADGNSTADMQQSGGTGLGGAAAPKKLSPEEFALQRRAQKKAQSLQGK